MKYIKILSNISKYSHKLRLLDIIKLSVFDKARKARLFGKEIRLTSPFWFLHSIEEIFINNTYNFQCQTTRPLIIDCGSNIGLSVIYFKSIYPNSRIIGFEPDNRIHRIASRNLEKFQFNNVIIHEKAVWVDNCELNFMGLGNLSGALTEKISDRTTAVSAVRLREFLLEPVQMLKIDIEGAEYVVLKDCQDVLCNVENIFVEYHSKLSEEQNLSEILNILKVSGFRVYIKEAWENMKFPFVDKTGNFYDLQLNIFGFRR